MIIPFHQLEPYRTLAGEQTIVATNGCFDVLHRGHVEFLQKAKTLGDLLVVGLNSDESVRRLKGEDRPVNTADDRACVLNALECVDCVCVFEGYLATDFLFAIRPNVWVKGGDYSLGTLAPHEVEAVLQGGGRIDIIPFKTQVSSTKILERIWAS